MRNKLFLLLLSFFVIGLLALLVSCSSLSPASSSSPAPPSPSPFVPPPFTVVAPTTTVYVTVPATQSPTPTATALEPINDATAMTATLKLDPQGDPNYSKDSTLVIHDVPIRIFSDPPRLSGNFYTGIADIGPVSQLSQIKSIPGLDWDGNMSHSPWMMGTPTPVVGHGYLFAVPPPFDMYAFVVTQEILDANNKWNGIQLKYALLKHFSVPQISVTPGPGAGQVTVSWNSDPYTKQNGVHSISSKEDPNTLLSVRPAAVVDSSPAVITVRTAPNPAGVTYSAYVQVGFQYPWGTYPSNRVQVSFK